MSRFLTRRAVLLAAAALAAAACSPRTRRPFAVGLLEPISPIVASAARDMGLEIASRPSPGAVAVSAAVRRKGEKEEVTADWSSLRFSAARAVVKGAQGVFFRLPGVPPGRNYWEYAEESQAVDRVCRELLLMRPILEDGASAAAPFAVASGVELRAWKHQGRHYVLLVNPSKGPLPLDERSLAPWRALFSVRADPREDLAPCPAGRCLPAHGVLWLEGRLLTTL